MIILIPTILASVASLFVICVSVRDFFENKKISNAFIMSALVLTLTPLNIELWFLAIKIIEMSKQL